MYGIAAALFWIVVLAAIVIPGIMLMWRGLRVPRQIPKHPSCSNCGYRVLDLPNWTCPECGQDLRRIGITTRALVARHRGSTFGVVTGWTLIMLCITAVGMMIVWAKVIYSSVQAVSSGSVSYSVGMTPMSGAGYTIQFDLSGTSSMGTASLSTNTLDLVLTTDDGASTMLTMDGNTGVMQYTLIGPDASSLEGSATADQAISMLYESAGLDTDGVLEMSEMADLTSYAETALSLPEMVDNSVPSQFFMGSASSSGLWSSSAGVLFQTDYTYVRVTLAIGALVWIVGLVLVIRRRRRLLRVEI